MFAHSSASCLAKMLISVLPLLAVPLAQASSYSHEQALLSDVDQFAPGFSFSVVTESSVTHEAAIARVNLGISISAASREEVKTLGELERAKLGAYLDTFPSEAVSYSLGNSYNIYEEDRFYGRKDMGSEEGDPSTSATYTGQGYTVVTVQDPAIFRSLAAAYANSTVVNMDWVDWKLAPSVKAAALRDLRHQIVREASQVGADYAEATMPNAHFRLADISELSVFENMYKENDGLRFGRGVDYAASEDIQAPKVRLEANVRYKFVIQP